jgi:DNA-binding PadR family transcriptional regulator
MDTLEIPSLKRRLKPNQSYKELSPKMKVALRILEYTDLERKEVYFSKLVRDMETIVSRKTIHQSLDSLIDQGTIRSEWTKNTDDRWVRGYTPASEGQKRMLRRTYYATHDDT